jgi:hypothetical protein
MTPNKLLCWLNKTPVAQVSSSPQLFTKMSVANFQPLEITFWEELVFYIDTIANSRNTMLLLLACFSIPLLYKTFSGTLLISGVVLTVISTIIQRYLIFLPEVASPERCFMWYSIYFGWIFSEISFDAFWHVKMYTLLSYNDRPKINICFGALYGTKLLAFIWPLVHGNCPLQIYVGSFSFLIDISPYLVWMGIEYVTVTAFRQTIFSDDSIAGVGFFKSLKKSNDVRLVVMLVVHTISGLLIVLLAFTSVNLKPGVQGLLTARIKSFSSTIEQALAFSELMFNKIQVTQYTFSKTKEQKHTSSLHYSTGTNNSE